MQEPAHIHVGIALAKEKKLDEAASHYRAALSINPDSAVAHNNLASGWRRVSNETNPGGNSRVAGLKRVDGSTRGVRSHADGWWQVSFGVRADGIRNVGFLHHILDAARTEIVLQN